MKPKTMGYLSWWFLAVIGICIAGLADDVLRHAAVLVLLAAAAVIGAYVLGRRRGLGLAGRQATRRLEESATLGQAAELEQLAGRSLDEICESYRHVQRQYRRQS